MLAWEDLQSRGKGWRSRFSAGVDMLVREVPDIAGSLVWPDNAVAQAPGRQAGR